jgi:hypothetical protein
VHADTVSNTSLTLPYPRLLRRHRRDENVGAEVAGSTRRGWSHESPYTWGAPSALPPALPLNKPAWGGTRDLLRSPEGGHTYTIHRVPAFRRGGGEGPRCSARLLV